MHNVLHTNSLWAATPSVCRMSNTYHISAYTRRRHSRVIHPCHVDIRPTMCSAQRFRLSICLFISAEVGLLCKQVFLDLGKTNIGDLLAIIYHSTVVEAVVAALNAANFCELVTDGDAPPTNTFQFPGPCKSGLFLQRWLPTSIGFPE